MALAFLRSRSGGIPAGPHKLSYFNFGHLDVSYLSRAARGGHLWKRRHDLLDIFKMRHLVVSDVGHVRAKTPENRQLVGSKTCERCLTLPAAAKSQRRLQRETRTRVRGKARMLAVTISRHPSARRRSRLPLAVQSLRLAGEHRRHVAADRLQVLAQQLAHRFASQVFGASVVLGQRRAQLVHVLRR